MVAVDIFDDAGYEIIEAGNGEYALAVLDGTTPIVGAFTDVQMPGVVESSAR